MDIQTGGHRGYMSYRNCFLPGNPLNNEQPASKHTLTNIPDGSNLRSTHACSLDISGIPEKANCAHIVLGLAHVSLILNSVLCGAGCNVQYDEDICSVYYNRKLVCKGEGDPQTRLWIFPLQENIRTLPETQMVLTKHMTYNTYAMKSKAALIKYLHQAEFSQPKQTLLKEINNKQLSTCPGFTAHAVQKYLPD